MIWKYMEWWVNLGMYPKQPVQLQSPESRPDSDRSCGLWHEWRLSLPWVERPRAWDLGRSMADICPRPNIAIGNLVWQCMTCVCLQLYFYRSSMYFYSVFKIFLNNLEIRVTYFCNKVLSRVRWKQSPVQSLLFWRCSECLMVGCSRLCRQHVM